jgi:fatty acid desaturase
MVASGLVSNFHRLARYRSASKARRTATARRNDCDPLVLRLIFTAAFGGGWIAILGWQSFLLLWIVPLFTTLPFMLRFRSIVEHFHLSHTLAESTRTLTASWLEREVLGFGPHLIGYHGVHHRFPCVPCRRLKQLHAELCSDPGYVESCCTTESYVFGRKPLVRELIRGAPTTEAGRKQNGPIDRPIALEQRMRTTTLVSNSRRDPLRPCALQACGAVVQRVARAWAVARQAP